MKKEEKFGLYFRCRICRDEIYHNTNSWPLSCGCGAMSLQSDGEFLFGEGDPRHVEAFEKHPNEAEDTKIEVQIC